MQHFGVAFRLDLILSLEIDTSRWTSRDIKIHAWLERGVIIYDERGFIEWCMWSIDRTRYPTTV